jgi:hypothetical protein
VSPVDRLNADRAHLELAIIETALAKVHTGRLCNVIGPLIVRDTLILSWLCHSIELCNRSTSRLKCPDANSQALLMTVRAIPSDHHNSLKGIAQIRRKPTISTEPSILHGNKLKGAAWSDKVLEANSWGCPSA